MSNGSLDAAEIDFSEAFSETSVLFNYTLGDDDGSAEEVINRHDCRNVVSKSVKREYEKVRDDICHVCGDPVEPDAGKFDPEKPVYDEDVGGVYHLGCENQVFEEVYCSLRTGSDCQ